MSDQKPPEPPGKSALAASQNKVSLSELIAKTPGAQTREQLLERIKVREGKRLKKQQKPTAAEEQLTIPEPMPFLDQPNVWAAGLLERFKSKEFPKRKPPKRSKPRVVVNNDKPEPSDKK